MPKTVTRLLPDKIAFVSKIENWLNDMAKQGLHLKLLRSKYAVFEKGSPKNTRYAIVELHRKKKQDEIKKYSEASWNLRCQVSTMLPSDFIKPGHGFYVFESVGSYDSRPTKDIFGKRKDLMDRYVTQKAKYIYYLLLAFAALVAAYFNISEHYILFLPSVLLTLALFFFILAFISVLDSFRIHRIQADNKKLGRVGENDWVEFAAVHKRRFIIGAVSWVLIFLSMLYIIQTFAEMITVSNLEKREEFISLEDIEEVSNPLGVTYGTWAPSLFASAFYIADSEGEKIADDGTRTNLSYDIVYNKSIIKYAVNTAYGNCILINLIDGSTGRVIFTNSVNFPRIAYINKDFGNGTYSVKICFCNDNEMLYIDYRGDKDVQHIIATVESKFAD